MSHRFLLMLLIFGMLVAVVTTLVAPEGGIQLEWKWVAGGLVLGSLLGALLARTVAMTGMPEMVALFNGFGSKGASWIPKLGSCQVPIGVRHGLPQL